MHYQSPDSDMSTFVDLGTINAQCWNGDVADLYAIVRPVKNGKQYVSLGARFSDDPSQYHSVPVMMSSKDVGDMKRMLDSDMDVVSEAAKRLIQKNILEFMNE